jgi:hypothetical protein
MTLTAEAIRYELQTCIASRVNLSRTLERPAGFPHRPSADQPRRTDLSEYEHERNAPRAPLALSFFACRR